MPPSGRGPACATARSGRGCAPRRAPRSRRSAGTSRCPPAGHTSTSSGSVRRAARVRTYAGLFLVSFATLLDEILLTRIFSVVTWYHFAFLAISIALFGMTLGAIAVTAGRSVFTPERTRPQMAWAGLLFAVTLAAGFLI